MICPGCGRENATTANFCFECGARLTATSGVSGARPSLESLAAAGADKRMRVADLSVAPPEDTTRLLTILFADMSGSVKATCDLDPEETADFLNRVLSVMVDAIQRQGGRISRFLGDGLVAYFGTPHAHEDDAERAIQAALEIRTGLQALGLNGTAGVNTGEVYLGLVGPESHQEFSAQGRSINLAARLQANAQPGQVLVGDATYRLARATFKFLPLKIDVKGFADPVDAYAVLGPSPRPQKARGIEGLRAGLQGRDAEFAELLDALAALSQGQGAAVAILGEAGIGKSRLIEDLRATLENRSSDEVTPLWLEGRCLATGAGTSYLPYLDAFRTLFGFQSGDSDQEKLRKVDASVAGLWESGYLDADRGREITAILANVLSLSLPADQTARLLAFGPEQLKNQTLNAVRDYLTARARQKPVVLVLEDLHWADPLSIELTSQLFELASSARLLILCLSRLDPEHRWRRLDTLASEKCGPRYRRVELAELTDDASKGLLSGLLGEHGLPGAVEELVLSRTQGNPFFIEEVVRSFIDAGVLHLEEGHWRMSDEGARVSIPESVQAVIQSRVDQLPDGERQILQSAAVIGRMFRRRVLAHLWSDVDELERGLWELQRRGLVFADRVAPEETYSFKHVLSQETIYRAIVRARRSELHHRIGAAIEDLYAGSLEEYWEDLAHHYDRSSNLDKAVRYLALAGEKSRSAFANETSLDYYKRALARLSQIGRPLAPDEQEIRIAVLEGSGDVLEFSGRHCEAVAAYEEALGSLPHSARIARGRVHRKIGKSLQVQRRIEDAFGAFDEAATALGAAPLSEDRSWWAERISVELDRSLLAYFAAPLLQLSAALEAAKSLVDVHGTRAQRGNLQHLQALAALRRSCYVADNETVEMARIAADASSEMNPAEVGMNRFIYGFCLLWAGRLDDSKEQLVTTLERASRVGDVTLQSRCLTYLTLVHRKRGDVATVAQLAARALRIAEAGNMIEYLAQANANLAWVAGRREAITDWERHAEIAWRLWQQLPAPGPYVPMAWIAAWPMLGVEVRRGRTEPALRLAAVLLEPDRQPMPNDVSRALSLAVEHKHRDSATSHLLAAAQFARPYGYL